MLAIAGGPLLCCNKPSSLFSSQISKSSTGRCNKLMSPIETRSEKQNTTRNTRDSQTPKTEYKDSVFDLLFINGCRQAFGRVAGWQVSQSVGKVSVLCFFPLDICVWCFRPLQQQLCFLLPCSHQEAGMRDIKAWWRCHMLWRLANLQQNNRLQSSRCNSISFFSDGRKLGEAASLLNFRSFSCLSFACVRDSLRNFNWIDKLSKK